MGVSGAAARFTIRASLFEWENLEQAHRYMSSEELRRKMKEAGVARDRVPGRDVHGAAERGGLDSRLQASGNAGDFEAGDVFLRRG
jgi:hypothetical protein